jgi:glycogen synthase
VKVALLARSAHPLHAPGGLERAVYEIARHLERAGAEVVLVTRPAESSGRFPGELCSVPYGALPGVRHGRALDRTLLYPAFAARVGRVAAQLVREGRADVVLGHGLAGLGYARARRRDRELRAPLVLNPHGMEEHRARGARRLALARLRALSREAASLADRVIATDTAMREDVTRLMGVEPGRVVVIPNGVDAAALRALTPEDPRAFVAAALPELRAAEPLLLSVGRLEGYKGFLECAQALGSLAAGGSLPASWAWAVVGDGPERGRLARAVSGLRGHVHLVGRVAEPLLHALYARADLFLHAPRYEGSSLVTLEAMVHGLSVVATAVGGIPDKVRHGEIGWLVAPDDVSDLGDAVRAALADPGERQARGARARALAEQAFGWPAIAQATLRVFESLLREARA